MSHVALNHPPAGIPQRLVAVSLVTLNQRPTRWAEMVRVGGQSRSPFSIVARVSRALAPTNLNAHEVPLMVENDSRRLALAADFEEALLAEVSR